MKKIILLLCSVIIAFVFGCTYHHQRGAGVGGAVGGVSGALLDSENPWRGGVIGAALGAVLGATLADISMHASREAVSARKPVEYSTTDGRGVYRAEPLEYNERTNCHTVREQVWEDGRVISDRKREICDGEKPSLHPSHKKGYKKSYVKIPPGHLPPINMCRIWYPGRPPGHQPPYGNCAQLRRAVPRGAFLVYGNGKIARY